MSGFIDQKFSALARRRKAEQIRAEGGVTTIRIDGVIGQEPNEISARWLRAQLPATGEDITLIFHSEGGSLLESLSMINELDAYRGKVRAIVSSMALSAASLLLTACDEVEVTSNSFCMMHDAHMDGGDTSNSEQKLLGDLSETMVAQYAKKLRKPASTIRTMLAAETWLNATEAVSIGLADRVVDASGLSISARAIPRRIVAKIKTKSPKASATARWKAAVLASGGDTLQADKAHPGLRLKMLAEVNKR